MKRNISPLEGKAYFPVYNWEYFGPYRKAQNSMGTIRIDIFQEVYRHLRKSEYFFQPGERM